jgi:hypothetical protein
VRLNNLRNRGKSALRGLFKKWADLRERRRLRSRVTRALKLKPRGAAPNDGLPLTRLSTRLEVEWYAREVQPWDRDLPPERQARLFVEQSLSDTVVAIWRMFERMAEIDVIDIRVLEPHLPDKTVLAGTVFRGDVNAAGAHPSPAMSLKLLGVRYRVTDGQFEPLS